MWGMVTVLRALRDRLPVELSAHLAAQLPLLVRGAFYEQWHVSANRETVRSLDDFLGVVSANLGRGRPMSAATAATAVFRTLARHVEPGQLAKVLGAPPTPIRSALQDAAAA
jgi:uncharacterized protein (DUF2267 family)